MPFFRRNSVPSSSPSSQGVSEPSKLRKQPRQRREQNGSWRTRFRRSEAGDVGDVGDASGRRDSSDSKASLSSSSSSRSSLTLFDSPRTSISSSPPSVHRIATSSTPSLQITPPTPELTPTSSAFDDDLPSDDERSAVWPFSSASLRTRGSSSSSNSSYTSSLFSLSSTSLSSSDRNDGSSMQQSSPSLFLSYLLKYSFPQVPPRSNLTAELTGARQLSEQGAHVDIGGNGGKTGSEPKRRLVDFYFDSSLRP